LLEIIGLPKPPQMEADSLLVSNAEGA